MSGPAHEGAAAAAWGERGHAGPPAASAGVPMHVVPYDAAPGYDAPGHHGMQMRRLQGREAGPADSLWLGLSVIAPGGGTTTSASAVEKFYVVIEGRLEVSAQGDDGRVAVAVLGPLDSCRIAPGESRRLHNPADGPCTVLLAMPHEAARPAVPPLTTSEETSA